MLSWESISGPQHVSGSQMRTRAPDLAGRGHESLCVTQTAGGKCQGQFRSDNLCLGPCTLVQCSRL